MPAEVETMAWSGREPWHGLGVQVNNDLTPEEMMVASGTNWGVFKSQNYTVINGKQVKLSTHSLIRDSDMSVLDEGVGEGWIPKQNAEAFAFFKEFVDAGDMSMETAGSLEDGKIVWVLAKVGKNFTLFGGDTVESYLLFSNPHKYGFSIAAFFTAIRVVCKNTYVSALGSKTDKIFKSSHRVEVTNDMIKETLGIVQRKTDEYHDLAEFLGSKLYNEENVNEYFQDMFPSLSVKEDKISRNARFALDALTYQPGVEFAPGSWWQAANAVTYVTDHIMARSDDTRLSNAWFGQTRDLKHRAMKLAKEYASKS